MAKKIKKSKEYIVNFSKEQIWNIGFELAKIIADGLQQFISFKRCGHPGDIDEKTWEWELQEMQWAMTQVAEDYVNSPHSVWFQQVYQELDYNSNYHYLIPNNNGKQNYQVNFPNAPQEIEEAEKEYNKRIEAGLQLFAKRLPSLWD